MTLTIDLTPELEARLRAAAAARGTDEAGAVRQLIESLPPDDHSVEALEALFDRWAEEDARKTPEEDAAEAEQWAQVEAGLKSNPVSFRVPDVDEHA